MLCGQQVPFSETWPTSGSMRSGRLYPPLTRALRIAGRGFSSSPGLLKTPTAQLAVNGGSQHPDKRKAGGHGPTLADQVEHLLLPTPSVAIATGGQVSRSGDRIDELLLSGMARAVTEGALLPTPTVSGSHGTDRRGDGSLLLPGVAKELTLLPTPNATDGQGGPRALPARRTSHGKDHGPRLRDVAPALLSSGDRTGQRSNDGSAP